LSDAVTGAIYNAISKTPRNINQVIEVHTWVPGKDEVKEEPVPYTPEQKEEALAWLGRLDVV
jgi:hypothetical protein